MPRLVRISFWPLGRMRRATAFRLLISGGVLLAALVAFIIWQAFQITEGVDRAKDAATILESLKTSEVDLIHLMADLPRLHGTLSQARDDLREARSNLKLALPLTPLVGWVPRIGDKANDGRDMLSLGEELVQGSLDLLTGLEAVAQVSNGPVILEQRQLNLRPFQVLTGTRDQLTSALQRLDRAEAAQRRLQQSDPSGEVDRLLTFSQRVLPDLKGLARMGLAVSQSWRDFLGYQEPRTYLLVAQNSDELRASGGYIPGAWMLEMKEGRIVRLQFWDTIDVDDLDAGLPTPPGGIVQSLWGGVWLFRDASWFPDFPTSAQVTERLFKLGTGYSVDGVVAVNQWAVKEIIAAIGPVTLPGGEPLDEATYFEVLEQGKDKVGRAYMDTVLTGLLDGLESAKSSERFASLLLAMKRALDQKHLLPYFSDASLQDLVLENGWGGKVAETAGDYLMVVDSNVGWNKVDRHLTRGISYRLTIDAEGKARARLDLSYTNGSTSARSDSCAVQTPPVAGSTYQEMREGCYWNYLRVYVPASSHLQNSSALPMPQGAIYRRLGYNDIEDTVQIFSEGDKSVYSGFFTVAPGETRRVTFSYDLPPESLNFDEDGISYSLVLQKQPGVVSVPIDVIIEVPDGYTLAGSRPAPVLVAEKEAMFQVTLESDALIELDLRKAR